MIAALVTILAVPPLALAATPRPRAERIVSLAPSVTETLFALGAGDEVVGVSQYCDYPPAATRLPRSVHGSRPTSKRSSACAPPL